VVEQLTVLSRSGTHTLIDNMDLRALLAVVEAAQAIENNDDAHGGHSKRHLIVAGDCLSCRLREALAALHTPDSAGEPD
jgi:hypothetical protein